jgi:hypothetical protein
MAKAPLSQTVFLTEDGSSVIPVAVDVPPTTVVPPVLAPVFIDGPTIVGTPQVGQTLTGMSTVENGEVVSRRWFLGGVLVATAFSYKAEAEGSLVIKDRSEGPGGFTEATSEPVTVLAGLVLNRLAVAAPLHLGQAGSTQITGGTDGSSISLPAGTGLSIAGRTVSGTPTVRSALLTEALSNTSRNTLVFAPETAARTMKLGMGVAGLANYAPNNTFIDHLKCSVMNAYPGSMNANGMPLSLGVDGNGNPSVSFQVPMPDGRTTPIKFRVITDGDMDFRLDTLSGDGSFGGVFTKEGADWVITYTGAPCFETNTTCYFQIKAIRTPPTRLALVRDDEAALFRSGRVFRPTIVNALQGFVHVRFMNWSDANMAEPCNTPDEYITYTTQGTDFRVVPLKYRAKLCKEASIGMWDCVHIKTTDAEYQARWPVYDELLSLGLLVKHELANEIWNSQFPQYATGQTRATALGYNEDTPFYNSYEGSVWYNGYRTAQLAKLARGRGYKWAVGCQPAQPGQSYRILQGFASANGVKTDVSIWTTANYMIGSMNVSQGLDAGQFDKQLSWVATNDFDAGWDNVLNYKTGSASANVPVYQAAVATADANGWVCETYEGGSLHANSSPGVIGYSGYDDYLYRMVDDPLYKGAMTQNHEIAQAAGIKVATQFDFDSRPANSIFGRFGQFGTPAFDAHTDWFARGGAADPITPPITALPRMANLITDWNAADIPVQTDNTTLASWTDSKGGLVASQGTGARQPRYRTNVIGGKPAVRFSGSQVLAAAMTGTALNAATKSADVTIIVVMCNIGAGGPQGAPISSFNGTTGPFPIANGTSIGVRADTGGGIFPYAGGPGLMTLDIQTSNGRCGANGSVFGDLAPFGDAPLGIGGYENLYSDGFFNGDVLRILAWDRTLTLAERIQAQKAICDYYSQPYPWANVTPVVCDGDSITNGYLISAGRYSYPAIMSQSLGLPLGAWFNTGVTGANYALLSGRAGSDIDPALALFGKPAVYSFFEWYNSARTNENTINVSKPHLAARKAAGWKVAFGTSTDASSSEIAAKLADRTTYDNYWDTAGNRAGLMDAYVPIHTDPDIGVAGACPSSGGNAYFNADAIHTTGTAGVCGNRTLAANMQTAVSTLL